MLVVRARNKKKVRKKIPQVAILLESSHEISRGMLRGILDYVRLHGPWALHLDSGGASDQKMPDLRAWRGSGIIARIPNAQAASAIVAARLPTVVIDPVDDYLAPSHPLSRCCRVQCNSAAVARRAADYYLSQGFKNFAFVGEPSRINWSRWRQESFIQRLEEAGFSCPVFPPPPPEEKNKWEVERRRMSRWLRRQPKPLAVFAANDARGRQVINACLADGIPVPYEVAVLAVNNDVLICETSVPPLSSIDVSKERAGYTAAEILDQLMRKTLKKQVCVTYDPYDVVTRASTRLVQVQDRLVIKALEFIRINSGLNIRVSDVATHPGVTERWMEKRFSQTLRRTVREEIHRVRMDTIRAMVSQTECPFNQIAHRCGFANTNRLGSIFKERFGMTMSEFRQQSAASPASKRQTPGQTLF